MYQSYDKNSDRPETGAKHVKTASFFIKTGFSFVKNRLQNRLRPGSARSPDGDAEKFISHVGGTFMPCFCILFGEKGRFIFKRLRFVDGYYLNILLDSLLTH